MDASTTLHTQQEVAKASGLAQTSISLMLRPEDRKPTKSGKIASPQLSEVERIANAFGMEVWQLLIDPATFAAGLARALSSPLLPTVAESKEAIDISPPTHRLH